MDVGVRELKARLSSYVQRASAGEVITVTDRGRPVAVLGPPAGPVDLSIGVTEGWITPASESGLRHVSRVKSSTTIAQAIAEDRGE